MVGTNPLAQEAFWANKAECDDAEKKYYQNMYGKVRQNAKYELSGLNSVKLTQQLSFSKTFAF